MALFHSTSIEKRQDLGGTGTSTLVIGKCHSGIRVWTDERAKAASWPTTVCISGIHSSVVELVEAKGSSVLRVVRGRGRGSGAYQKHLGHMHAWEEVESALRTATDPR